FTGANTAAVTTLTGLSATTGINTVTTNTNTGLLSVGMRVSGGGIAANSAIASIVDSTHITLTTNHTAAFAAATALTIPAGGAAGAGAINVNSPGILDVSGVAGGLTLLSGQTLTNSGTVN